MKTSSFVLVCWLCGNANGRVRCGCLNPTDAVDRDSLCIRVVHRASGLGTLSLLNESATDTRYTEIPREIAMNAGVRWAVRDGVMWLATHNKERGLLYPFEFSANFRAKGRDSQVDFRLSLVLRQTSAAPLTGEHMISVTSSSTSSIRIELHWTPCMNEAVVTIVDSEGPPAAATASAVRPIRPDLQRPQTWCFEASAKCEFGGSASTASIDLKNTPTACEQMAMAQAVNKVHIRYFLGQQTAENDLLARADQGLCVGSPDEVTYQRRLQLWLDTYRLATRLHIHMAFIAKSICSMNTAIDRQRAVEQEQMLQLPSYAEGCALPCPEPRASGMWLVPAMLATANPVASPNRDPRPSQIFT